MFFCRLSKAEKDSFILPGIQLQNVVHLWFFFSSSLLSHPNTQARYAIPVFDREFDSFSLLLLLPLRIKILLSLILIVILLKTVLNRVARELWEFENTNQMNYVTSMSSPLIRAEAEALTMLERCFMITLHVIYLDLLLPPLLLASSFPNTLYSLVLGVRGKKKKQITVADIFTFYLHCLNCSSLQYLHYSPLSLIGLFSDITFSIMSPYLVFLGFPNSSVSKEFTCNAGDPVQFLGREDLLEKG